METKNEIVIKLYANDQIVYLALIILIVIVIYKWPKAMFKIFKTCSTALIAIIIQKFI
jgi:hypothetical protein